jgi:hypothetical protein
MKTTIVTTTIYVPRALEKYGENARFYGHEQVNFIVVGDKKTPAETRAFCKSISAKYYPCEYMDVDDQRTYLERYPELGRHLPFNSIERRNVGLLKAWRDGAEVLITIDDDNLMLNQDFIGLHGVVGAQPQLPTVESSSGWFNVCSMLEDSNGTPFYPRGYPRGERWSEAGTFLCTASLRRRVAVNAGLWLDDPDIDAMTRMERPIIVRGMRPGAPERFALQPGTWSPFNSQNTALLREVIPAYFLSPCIGRYDDIWPSYIVNRIANHLGDVIAYGQPLVRQKRNEHNLWKDLDAERVGMLLSDEFCATLRSISLKGVTYSQCYGEMVEKLPKAWPAGEKWTDDLRQAREGLLEGMAIWHDVFRETTAAHDFADGTRRDLASLARVDVA